VIQPSLVFIQTQDLDQNGEEGGRLGSGIVIDDRGDILTSLHVVANASDIEVAFADGTVTSAVVIAEQPENDTAVLQAGQLPALIVPATLGNPNAMRVGDEAFAVGNPFGLYSSMTAGVISGFDRSFAPPESDRELQGLIQIDAAVNPGNSGGPLLNRYGQVIGIVVGIVNPTEQEVFIGIGFAVPINVAASAAGLPPY
jgi:serine protease DegQ